VKREESDEGAYDPQPPWLLRRIQEQRERLVGALSTVWPIPSELAPRGGDIEHALTDLEMILGVRGDARDVADYLYYQGAEMLGGVKPPNRDAVLPLAEALVRIHNEVWDRHPSV